MLHTKLCIFDFDGTLADTTSVIIKTMQATIKELDLPARTDEQCASMIGLRMVEILPVLFPECDIEFDLYAQTYKRCFDIINAAEPVQLYPNVLETLRELKNRGIVLTVASSRSNPSLNDYIRNLNLTDLVSLVLSANDVNEGKPNPEAIYRTLSEFGFNCDEAIMVGDTMFDIRMGINAGCRTCGVTYGVGSPDSLSEATWIIDDFKQLLTLV